MKNSGLLAPDEIESDEYRFDAFDNGKVLLKKKKNHLPCMGWNSWNAFGSGNTEDLTKAMADKIKELSLDRLGYKYLVLDDGCYLPERVDGKLANDVNKFPGGFKALSDYIHARGLKFGMYNDIGTNLCAGAAVGTCGHEAEDAKTYVEWGVDFLKVDNCYYLWDDATFSEAESVRYVFTPAIAGIELKGDDGFCVSLNAKEHGKIVGDGAIYTEVDGKVFVSGLGTFDGTGPKQTPVGLESTELRFDLDLPYSGKYVLSLDAVPGMETGKGNWIQIAVGEGKETEMAFDGVFEPDPINVILPAGEVTLRIMNHRRQENTLNSYAKLLEGLNEADPFHDIIYSMCEWGKNQPQNWGYKVGDSWRILNDITFQVGADGNPGNAAWENDYTASVTSQYNKAVIMDEFAGLDKGWNDPDMMVIGMNGINQTQMRTHFTMWCMMNSPLMLGLDLRRVEKGDEIYNIIANENLIRLNQDLLGVQAKRIYTTLPCDAPDKDYITNNHRVDVLAKPLSDGSVALSFINVSPDERRKGYAVTKECIINGIGAKMVAKNVFENAESFKVMNLWTGEESIADNGIFSVDMLEACDNVTLRIYPIR